VRGNRESKTGEKRRGERDEAKETRDLMCDATDEVDERYIIDDCLSKTDA